MTEKGSDQMLAELADLGSVDAGVRAEQERLAVEDRRCATAPAAENEPGAQYPDPDEAPPAAGAPAYDPTPPAS